MSHIHTPACPPMRAPTHKPFAPCPHIKFIDHSNSCAEQTNPSATGRIYRPSVQEAHYKKWKDYKDRPPLLQPRKECIAHQEAEYGAEDCPKQQAEYGADDCPKQHGIGREEERAPNEPYEHAGRTSEEGTHPQAFRTLPPHEVHRLLQFLRRTTSRQNLFCLLGWQFYRWGVEFRLPIDARTT